MSLHYCSTAALQYLDTGQHPMHHLQMDGPGAAASWYMCKYQDLRHYAFVSVLGPTVLCSSSTPLPGMMQCPSKYKVLL